MAKFLFTRVLWLVILELTLVRWGWRFNWDYSYSRVQVIWVLGVSMIVLAGLIYWPVKRIILFGIGMIILHNTVDGINADDLGSFRWLWLFLHEEGVNFGTNGNFWVTYLLIPWIGVMALGYGFGQIYLMPLLKRKNFYSRSYWRLRLLS